MKKLLRAMAIFMIAFAVIMGAGLLTGKTVPVRAVVHRQHGGVVDCAPDVPGVPWPCSG